MEAGATMLVVLVVMLLLASICVGIYFFATTRNATSPGTGGGGTGGSGKLVNRAWGSGTDKNFSKAPFARGDNVIVQGCYPYGKDNIAPILQGKGVPVAYMSVGTLESNDKYRVAFYQSLGVYDALLGASLQGTKIMNEPYYDPEKLASVVLPAYTKIIDAVAGFGAQAIEFDNMDFYKVNQEKPNATQAKIDAYLGALLEHCASRKLGVWQKNTMSLAPTFARHPACVGLITESVGESGKDLCSQFRVGFGALYGPGRAKPWFDFCYKKEPGATKKCTAGATAVLLQDPGGFWFGS